MNCITAFFHGVNRTTFLTYLQSEKRASAHTVAAYSNDLAQFEAFLARTFEVVDLPLVASTMVRSWLATLMEEGYSATSVHRKLSSLNAFYRFLQKNGGIQVNPVKGISKPKKAMRLPEFVDEKAGLALYSIPEDSDWLISRDHLMVTLFYETGIRLSELMGLKDTDIDVGTAQIKVLGKRNKMRLVPVSTDMLHRVATYQKLRDQQAGVPLDGSLFIGKNLKKIAKSVVYTTVKTYLSTVTTLKKKSPHILRHTFATHMLNNGADLNAIKEILGHSSLAATQVYTHNNIEKLRNVHASMHPRHHKV